MSPQNKEKGFIALISILIMSSVLLATTLSLAQFGIANRFFILDLEKKSASQKLAEACVHVARIEVYNDPFYHVTSPIIEPVGTETCSIVSITPGGSQSTIKTKGIDGNAITNLQVVVDTTNGNFLSWTELPTL